MSDTAAKARLADLRLSADVFSDQAHQRLVVLPANIGHSAEILGDLGQSAVGTDQERNLAELKSPSHPLGTNARRKLRTRCPEKPSQSRCCEWISTAATFLFAVIALTGSPVLCARGDFGALPSGRREFST